MTKNKKRRIKTYLIKPDPNFLLKMLENLFDHFLIFDESDDSHLTLALGAGQGINLMYFLNQSGPVFSILL
jgi:hypothetical protein